MDTPLITIGITCFNAEDVIIRSIRSATAQDYPNIEIVIVDDFSKDESARKIENFIRTEPRARLIRHTHNEGYPAALNTIVKAAKGDYVAFFDDDDVSLSSRLSAQLSRIKNFARAQGTEKIFCYTNRAVVLPGQSAPDHIAYAIGRKSPEPSGSAVADNILWHTHDRNSIWGLFGSGTLMVKTSYLRQLGPFDEAFRRSAEWDMAIRASMDGAYFIAVDEALVTQYKTPTADKSGKIPLNYALKLRDKHKVYLSSKGAYRASRFIAHYRFEINRKNYILAAFWMGLACLANPKTIGIEKTIYYWRNFNARKTTKSAGI